MIPFLSSLIFFGIPVGTFIWFVVSLCRYISAKWQNRKLPCTFPDKEIKHRKDMLILSAILAIPLVIVIGGILAALLSAVSYM